MSALLALLYHARGVSSFLLLTGFTWWPALLPILPAAAWYLPISFVSNFRAKRENWTHLDVKYRSAEGENAGRIS
jgi:hypothetical protein